MWNVCVTWAGILETVVETHALRDVVGNEGYLKLDGKPMSWLLEDCGDAAPQTASNWRNEMNEKNLGLCMLNLERGLRKTAWTQECQESIRAVVCRE